MRPSSKNCASIARPGGLECTFHTGEHWPNKCPEDGQEAEAMAQVIAARKLSSYKDLFPAARSLGRRRLTLYVGPTNSGKTYRALNALAHATSGVYLAPLRRPALEGQEELIMRGH